MYYRLRVVKQSDLHRKRSETETYRASEKEIPWWQRQLWRSIALCSSRREPAQWVSCTCVHKLCKNPIMENMRITNICQPVLQRSGAGWSDFTHFAPECLRKTVIARRVMFVWKSEYNIIDPFNQTGQTLRKSQKSIVRKRTSSQHYTD